MVLVGARCTLAGAAQVFVDESGHSGANYVDPGQPVFLTAAIIVPDELVEQVVADLGAFRRGHAPSGGTAKEIKFGTAVKRERFREQLATVILTLLDAGCMPVVDAWEKSFGIATRIVDAYFDYDYNPPAQNALPPNDPRRRHLAYFISSTVPDEALREFAKAYQHADAEALKASRDRLAGLLRLAGQPGAGDLLGNCDIDALVGDCGPESRHHRSLNFPSFLAILGQTDLALEAIGRRGPMTFDNQEEFRDAFDEAHDLLAPASVVDLLGASEGFRIGFSRITAFGMADSCSTPGLQLADAIGAVIRYTLCNLGTVTPGASATEVCRRAFGFPEGSPGSARFGVTSRLSAGEKMLRDFGMALMPSA